MEKIIADSCYWIGLSDPRDELHGRASKARDRYRGWQLVTTEEVLTEFLAHARSSEKNRKTNSVDFLGGIIEDKNVKIIPQFHKLFNEFVWLFHARYDKRYSLQDRISMCTMSCYAIIHVLTNDHRFTKKGFVIIGPFNGALCRR